MSKIKGKQLESGSIEQSKINVSKVSVVDNDNVTSKQYVDEVIAEKATLYYSKLNLNMQANNTTNVGQKTCNIQVIEFPISNVMVKVNGSLVDVGETKDCYFSPDGITKRTNGLAQKGDFLYWNSTKYNLDTTDEIDFIYLVGYYFYNLSGGTTVELNPVYNNVVVKFTGGVGDNVTVIINNTNYVCGNVSGSFVWDIGGSTEHTFTYSGESIVVVLGGDNYTVWFDGFGSLIFSVKKGGEIVEHLFNIEAGLDGIVYAVSLTATGEYVIGGSMTSYRGKTCNNILQVDSTGNALDTFSEYGFNDEVCHINKNTNGDYLVQGKYTKYNNNVSKYFTLLDSNGQVSKSFNQNYPIHLTDSTRKAYCSLPDDLILAGRFTLSTNTHNRIIRLNLDGSVDYTFDSNKYYNQMPNMIYDLVVQSDGKVIVGGSNIVKRFNTDGSIDEIFNPFIYGTVYTVALQSDGKVIIGGSTACIRYNNTNYALARFNTNGSFDTTFNMGSGFNATVFDVEIQNDDKILVTGDFSSFNGSSINRIARLNSDGTLDNTFTVGTGLNNRAYDIKVDSNGKILLGGIFTTYNGVSKGRIARLNTDGTLDTTFNASFGSNVIHIKISQSGSVFVGGSFGIVKLNSNGTTDTTFITGSNTGVVNDIGFLPDGKIIIGGEFGSYNNMIANKIAVLKSNGEFDNTFNVGQVGFNDNVSNLIVTNDKIYVVGTFTSYNKKNYESIVKFNSNGTIDETFYNANLFSSTSIVYDIVKNNDSLILAGDFTQSDPNRNYFVRINDNGTIDETLPNNLVSSSVFAIDILPTGEYILGGSFGRVSDLSCSRFCVINTGGTLNNNFKNNFGIGFDNTVNVVKSFDDGKYMVGGDFLTYSGLSFYGGYSTNGIINVDLNGGVLNTYSFNASATVYTSVEVSFSNYLYIGGLFSYTNSANTYNNILRYYNGVVDDTFNIGTGFNNQVRVLKVQTDGKILVGGNFTAYSGITRNRLIRLNSDGTIDNTFSIGTGFNDIVYDLAIQTDGKILVGGNFTTYSGVTRNRLIRLNSDGTIDNTFSIGTGFNSNYVLKTYLQTDGKIFLCGGFTAYSGVTSYYIIRLNSNGTIDNTLNFGTRFNNIIRDINIDSNGKILVLGDFTSYSGVTLNRIVRLNSDGTIDNSFDVGSGFNGSVLTVVNQTDGKYLIGGTFGLYNGSPLNKIIRLNSDGTIDTSIFKYGIKGNSVQNINLLSNDSLLIGGDFNYYDGFATKRLVKFNSDFTIDETFNTDYGFNDAVGGIESYNNQYLIAGRFTTVNNYAYKYLARLNSDGSVDSTFNNMSYLNSYINEFKTDGSNIYIGGNFLSTGNDSLAYGNRYTSNYNMVLIGDLSVMSGFSFGTYFSGGDVTSTIIQTDGKVIYGGSFTSYSGTTVNRIVRLNTDGTIDSTFNIGTGFNSTVNALKLEQNGKILVGGAFSLYNGIQRYGDTTTNRLAVLDEFGYLQDTYLDGFNGDVRRIHKRTNDFIIIGSFTTYSGVTSNRIISINNNKTVNNDFAVGGGFNDSAYDIDSYSNGSLVIVGNFSTYSGITMRRIVKLNSNGSIDGTFNIGVGFSTNPVYSVKIINDDKILVGGDFTTYSGITRNRIIQLNSNGTIDSTFNIGTGFNGTVEVLKVQTDGKILVGGNFTTYSGVTRNRLIRLNSDGTIDNTFSIGTGFNSNVYTIEVDANNKILVGGNFSTYSGITANKIIRLNSDGTIDTSFISGTYFSNTVRKIKVLSNGNIVVGGNFTSYNGIKYNSFVVLNNVGQPISTHDNYNEFDSGSLVYDIIEQDGNIMVGGSFTIYGGSLVYCYTRLNSDGSLDTSFNIGKNFYASVICISDDYYIGGSFTSFGAMNLNRIVKLNSGVTYDSNFSIGDGFNGIVRKIKTQLDGKVLVGGEFTTYSGTTKNRIIRLNTDGTIDSTFNIGTGFNNNVYDFEILNDYQSAGFNMIVVVGWFSTYNSVTYNRIAWISEDGTNFDMTATQFNNNVYCITKYGNDKLLIGGDFTYYDGIPQYYFTKINYSGILDDTSAVKTGTNGSVRCISTNDDIISIGGLFTKYGGSIMNYFGKLDINGNIDTGFTMNIGFDSTITCVQVQSDGKILVGGGFKTYDLTPIRKLIRLNQNGTIDYTFNNGGEGFDSESGDISSIQIDNNGKIIVSGTFFYYNGVYANRIIRLNSDGTVDSNFYYGNGLNIAASEIKVLNNNQVLLGGSFTQYAKKNRTNIVKVGLDASVALYDINAPKDFDAPVYSIKKDQNGKFLCLGTFTSYGLDITNKFIRLNADYTIDNTFNVGNVFYIVDSGSTILIQPDGKIIVGGSFTNYDTEETKHIIRLNTDGSVDNTFNTTEDFNGDVTKLKLMDDDKIICMGNFTMFGSTPINKIAVLNTNGTLYSNYSTKNISGIINDITEDLSIVGLFSNYDTDYINRILAINNINGNVSTNMNFPNFNNTISTICKYGAKFLVGGSFTGCLTCLNSDGTLDTTFNTGGVGFTGGANARIEKIIVLSDNKILAIGVFSAYNGVSQSYIVRLNSDGSLDDTFVAGSGAFTGNVYGVGVLNDGSLIVSGVFYTFSGASNYNLVALNSDGTLNSTLNNNLNRDFDNYIYDVHIQPDGKIILGGGFNVYANLPYSGIVRLNANGTIDTNFVIGTGFKCYDNSIASRPLIRKIYTLTNGDILIGGSFGSYNGTTVNNIAKLKSDGTLDTTFSANLGNYNTTYTLDVVYDISVTADNKILLGGKFKRYNSDAYSNIIVLNMDGTSDTLNNYNL